MRRSRVHRYGACVRANTPLGPFAVSTGVGELGVEGVGVGESVESFNPLSSQRLQRRSTPRRVVSERSIAIDCRIRSDVHSSTRESENYECQRAFLRILFTLALSSRPLRQF